MIKIKNNLLSFFKYLDLRQLYIIFIPLNNIFMFQSESFLRTDLNDPYLSKTMNHDTVLVATNLRI